MIATREIREKRQEIFICHGGIFCFAVRFRVRPDPNFAISAVV